MSMDYQDVSMGGQYGGHFKRRVIPCQITQYLGGFPHFVLDFLYMLTISAKICLGNIFQVIASKV